MDRRRFILNGAIGFTAANAISASHVNASQLAPAGFTNPIVAIGWGVYGEDKVGGRRNPARSKVPGTMVSLTAGRPKGVSPYFVTIFAQYRRNNDPWRDAPCHPDYSTVYSYDSRLRDIQELTDDFHVVSLFIPDAAHYLRPDEMVDIRMALRFFRTNNSEIDGTEQPLPHETVTPRTGQSKRIIEFSRPVGTPPFDLYDLANGRKLQIQQ